MRPAFILEDVALRSSAMTYRPSPSLGGVPGNWGPKLPFLTLCPGGWTNLLFDSNNCGECGVVCDSFHTCCEGECVLLVQNCGGCGPQFNCPPFHVCCSTDGVLSCTLTDDDPNNCGICENVCDYSPSPVYREFVQCCSQGACLFTDDFKTDPQHCGDCTTDCSVTCGPDCICSGGHCCPPCTVWYDGRSGPNWGLFGAIAGGLIEGALGALTLGLIGKLINDNVKPGCHSCSEYNRIEGVHFACCDQENCTNLKTDNANCGECGENCGIWNCEAAWNGQICTTSNRICQNGHCRCPPGLPDLCNDGDCVDPANDPNNCGGCGNICAPGQACCGGICTDLLTDEENCGSCGTSCGSVLEEFVIGGEHCCNGTCVDSSKDPNNCGACGNICEPGQACCGGICTDLLTDVQNCGFCGRNCGSILEDFIIGGGHTCCNGNCVDVSNDPNNCGVCGMICPLGESCSSGVCSIPIPIQ
jgi:hypothetical protein